MPCCCEDDDEYEDEEFYGDGRNDNYHGQFMETPKFYPGGDFQEQHTMPIDQQHHILAAQQMGQQVGQQIANHQLSGAPTPNHIQLTQQTLLAQQLAHQNAINSIQNSPGQSVQNIANVNQNIHQGIYSPG